MICTFSLCMRSSSREPCGACRTPSPARSRNWSQFRSTRPPLSWLAFCRQSGLRNRQLKSPKRGSALRPNHDFGQVGRKADPRIDVRHMWRLLRWQGYTTQFSKGGGTIMEPSIHQPCSIFTSILMVHSNDGPDASTEAYRDGNAPVCSGCPG